MEITFTKKKRPAYINFRMRKLIRQLLDDKNGNVSNQQLAEEIETIVSSNYWIKDKRKTESNNIQLKKVA